MTETYLLGDIMYLQGIKPTIKAPTNLELNNLSLGDFVELGFLEESLPETKVEFLFVKIEAIYPDKFIGPVNTDVKKLKSVYFGEHISFNKNHIVSVF